MSVPMFSRIVLIEDLPEEMLLAGDMGTVIEHHPATSERGEGYEVEFFTGDGETMAVVSVSAEALRPATRSDILHVRQLTGA